MIRGMEVRFSAAEKARALELIGEVIDRGWLMYGPAQESLEAAFCTMTGRKYAVTFSSNTAAQECLFSALKPRTVWLAGNHYPTPSFAARRCGAEVRWYDIEPLTLQPVLPERVAHPGEVIVVQETAGFLPDWSKLVVPLTERGTFVLEDCGQSVGSQAPGGRYAGSFGEAAVFSLAGTKSMSTGGQGGLIVTDNAALAKDLFALKNGGRPEMFAFDFQSEGWNAHMTEIQAAFGLAMLETMLDRKTLRADIATVYDGYLPEYVARCGIRAGSPNWFKYPVLLPEGLTPAVVAAKLAEVEIGLASQVYEMPSYRFPAWGDRYADVSLPGVESFCRRHVCLPMHNGLTPTDAQRVVEALVAVVEEVPA